MATVITRTGTVGELHALDPFTDRPVDHGGIVGGVAGAEVWVCDPTDSAIVLGSRQTPELVDADACRAAGLAIVRRRSGGGAVLLRPDAVVWIDVVLPHGTAPDDVRGSMVWIGERWAQVLEPLAPGRLAVHRGGMVCTPWSDLVCFAGVGPGEVLVDDRKFLGLSQRRTRHGIRVQGTLYRRPVTGEIPVLLSGPTSAVALDEPHFDPSIDARELATELAAVLSQF
jgi:lipoate-protein ligase A